MIITFLSHVWVWYSLCVFMFLGCLRIYLICISRGQGGGGSGFVGFPETPTLTHASLAVGKEFCLPHMIYEQTNFWNLVSL